MAAHSLDTLLRSLKKGDLAPVYYFYGPEDVLKDEAVRTILELALEPGMREFNLDQRSAGQLDPEEVYSLCNTLPMLADRRVVVLREVEAWRRKTRGREEFLRYLQHPSQSTLVILVQGSTEDGEDKELSQHSYSVRFEALSPSLAVKWVLRQAGRLGVNLEAAAAEHLVRAVGADLGALSSELGKLASLPADLPVTLEQVGSLVGVRHGETPLDWRSAIIQEQTGQAVSLLPIVLAQPGMSGVKLVTALGTSLIGLALTRSSYDKGLRGHALDDAVFKALLRNRPGGLLGYKEEIARWTAVVARWPAARLRAALRAALEADQALKNTTVSDERGVLTDLVLQLGVYEGGKGGESGRILRSSSNRLSQMAGRALSILCALSALSAFSAHAQTDPRLVEIISQAQQGQGDSARIKVQKLLAATSPTDTLYPQIIYTQAMVSGDAADMRRQLQRIAVEYSSSSWADDALLRLVQLDYASGNLDGAGRNLERIRQDYPGSSLTPQAAYWGARTYFDQKKPDLACRWISEGMAASQGNIEAQNQLGYLNQRCGKFAVAGPVSSDSGKGKPPADSQAAQASTLPDTAKVPLTDGDTLGPPGSVPVPVRPVPATVRSDTLRADSLAASPHTPTPPSSARYRVQITAVRSQSTAQALVAKLKGRGFSPVVVEEGGLYKVRVGEYVTKGEAAAALPAIKAKLGGSPFVVAGS
jgi:DNA polymerase-3 subunit delta